MRKRRRGFDFSPGSGGNVWGRFLYLCGYGRFDKGTVREKQAHSFPRGADGSEQAVPYHTSGQGIFWPKRCPAAGCYQKDGQGFEYGY